MLAALAHSCGGRQRSMEFRGEEVLPRRRRGAEVWKENRRGTQINADEMKIRRQSKKLHAQGGGLVVQLIRL